MKDYVTRLPVETGAKMKKLGALVLTVSIPQDTHEIGMYLISSSKTNTEPFDVEGIGNTQLKLDDDTSYSDKVTLYHSNFYNRHPKKEFYCTIRNEKDSNAEFQITNFDGDLQLSCSDSWGWGIHAVIENFELINPESSFNPIITDNIGNIDRLKGLILPHTKTMQVNQARTTGDISSLSTLTALTSIEIRNNPNITGDISSLSTLTALTSIKFWNNPNITGDISSLSTLTALTSIRFWDNPNITGDISSLSTLTALTSLTLNGANFTGDISSIVTNCTKLKTLEIPKSVTITDEQKKILTDRGCTVTIYN